mgnify:FL=1
MLEMELFNLISLLGRFSPIWARKSVNIKISPKTCDSQPKSDDAKARGSIIQMVVLFSKRERSASSCSPNAMDEKLIRMSAQTKNNRRPFKMVIRCLLASSMLADQSSASPAISIFRFHNIKRNAERSMGITSAIYARIIDLYYKKSSPTTSIAWGILFSPCWGRCACPSCAPLPGWVDKTHWGVSCKRMASSKTIFDFRDKNQEQRNEKRVANFPAMITVSSIFIFSNFAYRLYVFVMKQSGKRSLGFKDSLSRFIMFCCIIFQQARKTYAQHHSPVYYER